MVYLKFGDFTRAKTCESTLCLLEAVALTKFPSEEIYVYTSRLWKILGDYIDIDYSRTRASKRMRANSSESFLQSRIPLSSFPNMKYGVCTTPIYSYSFELVIYNKGLFIDFLIVVACKLFETVLSNPDKGVRRTPLPPKQLGFEYTNNYLLSVASNVRLDNLQSWHVNEENATPLVWVPTPTLESKCVTCYFAVNYFIRHVYPLSNNPFLSSLPFILFLRSVLICLGNSFNFAEAQSFIGVNYGEVADNLPPATDTAKLLQSTTISKVRMYGADPAMLKALANTGIGIVIGASNGDIPALATDPNQATQWINSNVIPYFPASNIILITVGNEVISSGDQNLISQLLPAMQNVENALKSASLGSKIKVSTVHSMAVLSQSDPPSSGAFNPALGGTMKALLEFLKGNGSPFTINPYPFFAYQSDPRPETLSFCLFQPNAGRVDSNTNIKYMNMFDAQVDAVHSALNAMGYKDVEIVVAETGWPYNGDTNEAGTTIDNAKAYNGGLISHLRSMVGTPLMPGKSVDTYIFALYDEDLKPGPTSERSFGLYRPNLTMAYDAGLSKSSQAKSPSKSTPPPATTTGWCVPKQGVSDSQLQAALDYACSQPGVDCGPIQPGGACFDPNTVASHAAYAMNSYYQASSKQPSDCDFSQTATVTSVNPSYNSCVYPRGGAGVGGNSLSSKLANKAERAAYTRKTGYTYKEIILLATITK
ncbi:uncharacterized protein [Phyllobates terribilis]|uniref:uncharacterized protein n=1 Tax=Phyllobates terribilis TaxID=111132 RepID=UPI003CCB0F2C